MRVSETLNQISTAYIEVIVQAVENKYEGLDPVTARLKVEQLWTHAETITSERALVELIRSPDTPEQDLQNQVATAYLIHRYWRHDGIENVIWRTYASVYAKPIETVEYRTTETVPDFDAPLRVEPVDVRGAIMELERFIGLFVFKLRGAEERLQAAFLAYVFASIIRIHAYPDGNGRTARFVAQYCLEVWRKDPIIIPKVRNSPKWKDALQAASNENTEPLTDWFYSALTNV